MADPSEFGKSAYMLVYEKVKKESIREVQIPEEAPAQEEAKQAAAED